MTDAAPTFKDLFNCCQASALHLEMRDGYSRKDPAFIAWQSGATIDPRAYWPQWFDMLRPMVTRRVTVRRARIVSEPISDYVRFEYDITTALNIAAGEDVRWLIRRRASDLALPGNDFWLFDNRIVMVNHFDGMGQSVAHESSEDPALVRLCRSAFQAVWERATPHADYQPT